MQIVNFWVRSSWLRSLPQRLSALQVFESTLCFGARGDEKFNFVALGAAAVLAALVGIRYFQVGYFPLIDTGWSYEFFSYALGQIRAFGQAPLWVPEVTYGLSANFFWLTGIGPAQHIFLLIGSYTNFSALNLYIASMMIDQFIFLLGVVLLAQRLFGKSPLVFFYVVAATALLLIVDNQIFWNFRLFQTMPFAVFFLILSVERCRMFFAMMAVLTVIVFSFGSLLYTLPFQIYTLMLFFVSLAASQCDRRQKLVAFLKSAAEPANIVVMATTIGLFAVLVLLANSVQSEFAYIGAGRGHGLQTHLIEYLTYGQYTGLFKLVELVTAQPVNKMIDFTSFFGSAGVVLLIYAALVERSPIFKSLLILFLWIVAFSVADTKIAHLAFYLPGMDYFRHIGYVVGSVKWVAVICAAYGLTHLVRNPPKLFSLLIAMNACVGLFILAELVYCEISLRSQEWMLRFHLIAAIALLAFVCGFLFWLMTTARRIGIFVLLLALGELVSYRAAMDYRYPADPSARAMFANAAAPAYQPQRIWPQESERLVRFRGISNAPIHYDIDAAFNGVDLCGSNPESLLGGSNLIMPAVKDFFGAWRGEAETAPPNYYGPDLSSFLKAIGCHTDKMRLVFNPVLVADEKAASDLIARHSDIFDHPVLLLPAGAAAGSQPQTAPDVAHAADEIKITQYTANSVQAIIMNPSKEDAWLVYNDAFTSKWNATLDGRSEPVVRANLAFKAIDIPPGLHTARFALPQTASNYFIFPGGSLLFGLITLISLFALSRDWRQDLQPADVVVTAGDAS
jgi:hypothetical protein